MIIDLATPNDIESFTAACKRFYYLAAADLEIHYALKRKHAVYRYSSSGSQCSPAQLLDEIIREPRTALYVRKITLSSWHCRWVWQPNLDRHERLHLPYSEEIMSSLMEAVSKYVRGYKYYNWVLPIELGDEDQIISLLLMSLPNLSTLKIDCLGPSQNCLKFTIYRIARMKGPGAPLSRLHHTQITEGELLDLVAALASMRSIHCLGITASGSETWPDKFASKTFTVRDLVFERCSINTKRLCDILEAFKALHSFTYDSDYRYEKSRRDERAGFDPFWARKVLSFHAISTLESLTLLSHDKDRHWMGNIRCFQTLHNLHTEMQLLLKEENHLRKWNSLVIALPPNLETLKLECSGLGDELMIAKLITTLAQLKTLFVPALKKVEVMTRNGVQDFNTSITDDSCASDHKSFLAAQECYTYEAIVGASKKKGFELLVKAFDTAVLEYYERDDEAEEQ